MTHEYVVSIRGREPQYVDAENWLMALGRGLEAYGMGTDIERLACERLHNGSVIARDIGGGVGLIIRQTSEKEEPAVEIDDDEELPDWFGREVTSPGEAERQALLLDQVSYASCCCLTMSIRD